MRALPLAARLPLRNSSSRLSQNQGHLKWHSPLKPSSAGAASPPSPGRVIFAGIQPIHPADELASVTTSLWAVIISLKFAMCLFFLIGFAGLYARQAEKAGWLGFVGFALLTVSWFLQTGFVFVELFVLPVVANALPGFVDSALGIANGHPGVMNIGALVPTLCRGRSLLSARWFAAGHRNGSCGCPATLAGDPPRRRCRDHAGRGVCSPTRSSAIQRSPWELP